MNDIETEAEGPQLTYRGFLDMQVCVPEDWDDDRVKSFADSENFCGTTNGWFIRREGDKALGDSHERVPCADREGYVHIMLDA